MGSSPTRSSTGRPRWAAEQDGWPCSGDECAVYPPRSTATKDAFAAFAAAAVERYGPGGEFWSAPVAPARRHVDERRTRPACPRPGSSARHPPPTTATAAAAHRCPPAEPPCGCTERAPDHHLADLERAELAQVLRAEGQRSASTPRSSRRAGNAIHAVDPAADVILGGMWGPGTAKEVVTPVKPYLKKLYAVNGIEQSFDSIAIHPYAAGAAGLDRPARDGAARGEEGRRSGRRHLGHRDRLGRRRPEAATRTSRGSRARPGCWPGR